MFKRGSRQGKGGRLSLKKPHIKAMGLIKDIMKAKGIFNLHVDIILTCCREMFKVNLSIVIFNELS